MPKFTTVRFGELEYETEDVIQLVDGLVGMPDLRRWLILEMGEDVPMKWFQSLDRGDFGFPVSQATLFHDEYEIEVPEPIREKLGSRTQEDLAVLIITTVHPGGDKVTGNLLAPVIVDIESRNGVQLTLDDDRYGLRQEINYFKFGLAVQSQAEQNGMAGVGAGAPGGINAEIAGSNESSGEEKPEPVGV